MTSSIQYWPYHGPIATLALLLIWISIPILIIHTYLLYKGIGQIRKCASILCMYSQPSESFKVRLMLDTSTLKNSIALRIRTMADALEIDSKGTNIFNVASMIRQVLFVISDQFLRTAYRLKFLGWSVLLVAGLGTLAPTTQAFRSLFMLGEELNIKGWAMIIADAIPILTLGVIISFTCIGIAGYFRERLEHLIRDVVYIVLTSAPKREPSVRLEDLPLPTRR